MAMFTSPDLVSNARFQFTRATTRTGARERNGQVGKLPYQLWDWYGELQILPYKYFLTAYCKPTA